MNFKDSANNRYSFVMMKDLHITLPLNTIQFYFHDPLKNDLLLVRNVEYELKMITAIVSL